MKIKEYVNYDETEILNLYESVGWTAYIGQPETLRNGFLHSLLTLAAYEDEKLVGIIRVVGDGYTIVFIQDILICPEYQRKGIGTELVREVLNRFRNVRQIELVTDNTFKTTVFYKSLGFSEMSEIGCCGFLKC